MSINLSAPQLTELKPRIVVIGVGGAGGNAVNNMIRSGLGGVEFIVANTDAQALSSGQADRKIQLGVTITQGLGCGARPEVGRMAAEEALDQIMDHMQQAHMVFITAGMGGGTGTGGAPVIAQACRDYGILTVGVVTKPFHFEGSHRMKIAESGIAELQSYVDTLIAIPNQNLFRVANEKTTFADAFAMADQVLASGVRGITDLMVMPGLINLDFADVKTVMSEMGKAMMGTGEAEGEKRAIDAAEAAISNPLLDEVSMAGAKGLLINITGGLDLTLYEVDEAANRIREEVDPDANIIVGSALDDSLAGRMRVSVVATGIDAETRAGSRPAVPAKLFAVGGKPVPSTAADPRAATAAAAMPAMAERPSVSAERIAFNRTMPALRTTAQAQAVAEMPAAAESSAPLLSRIAAAVPESVPHAKPLAPEPETMPVRRPSTEAGPIDDAPFIAPEPVEPPQSSEALRRPNPMAEADAVNAGGGETRRPSRAFGLFRRMAGAGRGEPEAEPARPARPGFGARAEPRIADAPVATAAPTAAPPAAPAPVVPEPQENLAGLKPQEDADLLEIPSFLRRQAN
jgi:cell division protein FtsZ